MKQTSQPTVRYCAAITCMDGMIHATVINYLNRRFKTQCVDMITEPGPNLILARHTSQASIDSIMARLRISLFHHQSCAIAIIAHAHCAGNRHSDADQLAELTDAVQVIVNEFGDTEVIGLWINDQLQVTEIPAAARSKVA